MPEQSTQRSPSDHRPEIKPLKLADLILERQDQRRRSELLREQNGLLKELLALLTSLLSLRGQG